MAYTAIVLHTPSQRRLKDEFAAQALMHGCHRFIGHHITLMMGVNKGQFAIGDNRSFTVTHVGWIDGRVFAAKVDGADDSYNITPHITCALGHADAKPRESNDITEWTPVQGGGFTLFGTIEICQ